MKLAHLNVKSFRNYNEQTLDFHPSLNLIIGHNAQGKTSLLEAIHMLSITKSHRTLKDQDVIQNHADFAKVEGNLFNEKQKVSMSIVISKNGKKVQYNGMQIAKLSDYLGYLTVVMFAPEDLDLIKGSPSERRRFMDLEIAKLKPVYLSYLNHYRRLLKERNDVLKGLKNQRFNDTLLDVLTDQLIHYAEKIITFRKEFMQSIGEEVKLLYKKLSEENQEITLMYQPSVYKDFKKSYQQKLKQDTLLGVTHLGPHRDEVEIIMNKHNIKSYASQGQIRTVVIALKLAVVNLITKAKSRPPVILLDDVFSELDSKRQTNLIKTLNIDSQVFITTNSLHNIALENFDDYKILTIKAGEVKGEEDNAITKL